MVVDGKRHQQLDSLSKRGFGIKILGQPGDPSPDHRVVTLKQNRHEGLLARKSLIDGADGNIGALRNLRHADVFEQPLLQQQFGRGQDALERISAAFLKSWLC